MSGKQIRKVYDIDSFKEKIKEQNEIIEMQRALWCEIRRALIADNPEEGTQQHMLNEIERLKKEATRGGIGLPYC
jgi:hypothetical protein